MNIRTICLAMLAHGEASGYDLKKGWENGPFSYLGGASFGSIYPALAKMEEGGLIRSREESQPGKPPRRVYALTERGRAAFLSEMSETPEKDIFRSHFGIIALCAPFLPRETIARAIDERLDQQRREIEALEPLIEREKDTSVGWLIEWGVAQFRNEVDFIAANRARLESLADTATPGAVMPVCKAETETTLKKAK